MDQYDSISNPPEALYTAYLPFAGLLPNDAGTWGFNIASLYWDALTDCLKMALSQANIDPPNPNTMATKGAQLTALRALCTAASRQASALRAQYDNFRHLLKDIADQRNHPVKHRHTPKHQPCTLTVTTESDDSGGENTPSATVYRHSVAEQVIKRYSLQSGHAVYPISPDNGAPADFPKGHRGCLSCGDATHIWRAPAPNEITRTRA
ncbi:MAG: hypothetical protein ACRDL7_03325 [Gaiellaceae bacterium]